MGRKRRWWVACVCMLAAAVIVVGCGGDDDSGDSNASGSTQAATTASDGAHRSPSVPNGMLAPTTRKTKMVTTSDSVRDAINAGLRGWPIAVLAAWAIRRRAGQRAILEHNIVQTTGSAGESVAAAVVFSLPALIFLGYPLQVGLTTLVAITGGCLGVLLMIPLRRWICRPSWRDL